MHEFMFGTERGSNCRRGKYSHEEFRLQDSGGKPFWIQRVLNLHTPRQPSLL
jgi:hypothetical protein